MTYEQLQGRLNWRVEDKLVLSANGGFEDRQFLDSGLPNSINPIWGVSAHYQLFEGTGISVGANQTVSPSYFQNELTESISFTGGIQQRLFKELYLDLNGGYSFTTYKATTLGLVVSREDDYSFVSVGLSIAFLKHGSASVFYLISQNSSRQAGFSYSSSQFGVNLGWNF